MSWEQAERELAHLEVVQGLPGHGLPPELDAQEQQHLFNFQQERGREQAVGGHAAPDAQNGSAPPAPPPPSNAQHTPPQGPPSPPEAPKAAPGTGAKPEKNPTQE